MLSEIRNFLSQNKLDAIVITRTDSFLGEYYPPEREQMKKATGFSGSAGLAVITLQDAVLFVDSRYTEQAKIEASGFQVFEVPTEMMPTDWMTEHLKGASIGYNPWQRSVQWVAYMTQKKLCLKEIPLSKWEDLFSTAEKSTIDSFDYDTTYCGEDHRSKLKKIISFLKKKKLDAYFFTTPDSVSYLLNKRSRLVEEYPVVFERLIVFSNGKLQKLSDFTCPKPSVTTLGMNLTTTPMALFEKLKNKVKIIDTPDPIEQMKSVKNPVEQDNIRQACFFESTVICRFLAWIEKNKQDLTEWDCGQKLKELRSQSPLYRGDSFDTIAAVGEHAARPHYQATKESSVPVLSAPLLLIDTGGNYLNGTTDMTRTICVGTASEEIKKRYTQVLKGHIALATTAVKAGDLPTELDRRARSFLRADGVDYGHSTGHGISMYLAVHETPPTIYEKSNTPLKAGMLFSNEPAFYKAGEYGIRLENMILTVAGPENGLILENLLWIPFDGRLILFDMLTDAEKEWLRAYHKAVQERICPALTEEEQSLLKPLLDFFL